MRAAALGRLTPSVGSSSSASQRRGAGGVARTVIRSGCSCAEIQIAALAFRNEYPLHPAHVPIERGAHLSGVVEVGPAASRTAPGPEIQQRPFCLRKSGSVDRRSARRRAEVGSDQRQCQGRQRPRRIDQLAVIDAAGRAPARRSIIEIERKRPAARRKAAPGRSDRRRWRRSRMTCMLAHARSSLRPARGADWSRRKSRAKVSARAEPLHGVGHVAHRRKARRLPWRR